MVPQNNDTTVHKEQRKAFGITRPDNLDHIFRHNLKDEVLKDTQAKRIV